MEEDEYVQVGQLWVTPEGDLELIAAVWEPEYYAPDSPNGRALALLSSTDVTKSSNGQTQLASRVAQTCMKSQWEADGLVLLCTLLDLSDFASTELGG